MYIKYFKNSVFIRLNNSFFFFSIFFICFCIIVTTLIFKNMLKEMRFLHDQIQLKLDLLEKKETMLKLIAHSSYNPEKSYWNFLAEGDLQLLLGFTLGAFILGVFIGGYFSFGTSINLSNVVPLMPGASWFNKQVTETTFVLDYASIKYTIKTIVVSGEKGGVCHLIKRTEAPDMMYQPLDCVLSAMLTDTTSTSSSVTLSSEFAGEAAKIVSLFLS